MAKGTTATTAMTKAKPAAQMQVPWGKPGAAAAPPASGTSLKIPSQTELAGGPGAAGTSVAALKQVDILAHRLTTLEDEIERLNLLLEEKGKQLTRLKMVDIPNAMAEAGTKYVELESGEAVEVEKFITGNIKEENREKAHAWLRKNNFGSLIKNTISCAFGMGEDAKALAVMKWLAGKKIPFAQKEAVHAGTLRSFVRERLEAGKALPPSIDYTSVPTATVKRPKPNKE